MVDKDIGQNKQQYMQKVHDLTKKICIDSELSGDVQSRAREICKAIAEKTSVFPNRKRPDGYAAGIVYISSILCNERRTQQEVADSANVPTYVVSQRYKELSDALLYEADIEVVCL